MMKVITSTHHQLLKYPIPIGMADIRNNQAMVRTIAAVTQKKSGWMTKTSRAVSDKDSHVDKKSKRELLTNINYKAAKSKTHSPIELEDQNLDSPIESGDPNSKTEEEPESFLVNPHHPEQVVLTGSRLHPQEKTSFKEFLSDNLDVFAGSPTDMPGIDHSIFTSSPSRRTPSQ